MMLMVLTTTTAMANDKSEENATSHQKIIFSDLYGRPFISLSRSFLQPAYVRQDLETQNNPSLKSPKKGLLFSVLIPGSGELYANSWLKGLFFVGVEVTAWTIYAKNQGEGKDLKKEFEAYAEEHWSRSDWEIWWNSLPEETRQQWAHHTLPETKTQQYYEMIGKYQKFNAGWIDVIDKSKALSDTSANGRLYMSVRGRSNDKLKLAGTMTGIALANHVLSALDAVWTVSRFNRNIKPSTRVKYTVINGRPTAMATLQLSW